MAEWYTEPQNSERNMEEKGEVVPSKSEEVFRALRKDGSLKISPQDAEWFKKLASILWV